jgi:phosphatidylglycerophosphatase A|tara:strand:- start:635 stop:1087 length:453 start_codon:yes stop_codon:yes gene_type:complete
MNKVSEIISTVFYIGRLPFAPGTWCSFVALLAWFFLRFYIEGVFILYASLVLFFIGVAVSTIHAEALKDEDPAEIVIDEWVGQWIALWMVPHSFIWGFVSFSFFRIFDIFKPGPIQSMDDIKSGTGIMMDDVIAGILALLVTQSLFYFIG